MLAQSHEGEGGTQSEPLRLLLQQPLEGRKSVRAETGSAFLKRHPELGVHLAPEIADEAGVSKSVSRDKHRKMTGLKTQVYSIWRWSGQTRDLKCLAETRDREHFQESTDRIDHDLDNRFPPQFMV